MAKKERIEDLGRIFAKLEDLYKFGSPFGISPFEECISKHTIDEFIKKYSDPDKLYDLHNWIRWLSERLNDIESIARGLDEDF